MFSENISAQTRKRTQAHIHRIGAAVPRARSYAGAQSSLAPAAERPAAFSARAAAAPRASPPSDSEALATSSVCVAVCADARATSRWQPVRR